MISKEVFENIKEKHGIYASWAVWVNEKNEYSSPKENIDNLSVFNLKENPQLLQELKPNIIMVGLNCSGDAGIQDMAQLKNYPRFTNFHAAGRCNDHKLRYVFRNTELYGAYMTDFYKLYAATNANLNYINDKKVIENSQKIFEDELNDLDCKNELIIAMHGKVYKRLIEFLKGYNIIKIPHYSSRIANDKDDYRKRVLDILKDWIR